MDIIFILQYSFSEDTYSKSFFFSIYILVMLPHASGIVHFMNEKNIARSTDSNDTCNLERGYRVAEFE